MYRSTYIMGLGLKTFLSKVCFDQLVLNLLWLLELISAV